ncbi:unnamed protein product, partial [Nippostrongylus brasiliensis]|uniref:FSA_C domain-containing protein n=1 Tax=Nippostrongylus brasiliensis TaxID=27835 RepID=A0A0N4YYM8_NIPBR
EHVIPPFHYAQFAVRRGPFVSPCGSDVSETLEDELRDNLREIMDLSVLEPPAAVTPLAKLKSQSNELSNGTERRQQFPHPMTTGKHAVQVYGLNEGLVHGNPQFVSGELNPLCPQRHVASSSPAQCSTSDDSAAEDRGGKGILRERSSTCSSDTDVLRRGWDLSPSVSPLTLDALSSALSSPEESDSNDEQFGAPVWPTMSRKHAKLAIAVCRNMPKHLQPLCRRFAWQQGITYLLENFCLHKWEIRPEHDTESVWFFDNFVRRFKPFELLPWDVPSDDEEPPKRTENIFFGFNICADISMVRCRKTIKIEDRFSISFTCEEVPTKDGGGHDGRSGSISSPTTLTEHIRRKAASARIRVDDSVSDESDGEELVLPTKLSYEKQKFIALSCCKQFLEQLQLRKADKPFRSSGKSMVDVSHIMSLLYREHRAAYELMMSDIRPIPTPDPREIPYSDDAEWVASRILAINRAQNRLIIPSLPPWAAMHRLWSVYGPLRQAAAVIGGDYEQFASECINVACNHYYRLIPLRRRETPSSFPSQRTANAELLTRCRRVYDEKRQTKRRRWNTMRYLHNAMPGCVIEGIDVFDMAQRTNLSVAGIFGPEHKLSLTEMPFASNTDNRPAYLDMEELLNLMNHTIALQSGTTVDQDKCTQPCIDFLTTVSTVSCSTSCFHCCSFLCAFRVDAGTFSAWSTL